MARVVSLALVLLLVCGGLVAPTPALAGDEKQPDQKGAEPKSEALTLASDEEVAAALAEFKVNYKAKGLPAEDKTTQRDWAMQQIAPLQHPDVIKALGKVSKSGDEDLRMLALIYLGDQKALAHQAAKPILAAMKKDKKNVALLMTGLQSLGSLRYLGARKEIAALFKHRSFAVKKAAIAAVGDINDVRMLQEILRLIGVKVDTEAKPNKDGTSAEPDKKEGGKEVVEEGYSWEGAEATVDRGEADNTQENADAKAQAEAQIAANKAAAQASAGSGDGMGGGSTGGGSLGVGGSGGGGRGGQSRSLDELNPTILKTFKKLTGEEFGHPSIIKKWLAINGEAVRNNVKVLDKKEKDQKKAN